MPPKRVLIVDDSKDMVEFLRDALKSLDPTLWITAVTSAEDALLETFHHKADLLIADVGLPGISGLDLVKKSRTSNRAVRAILISGLDDPDLPARARQYGADAFIGKPVNLDEFLSTVDHVMGLGKNLPPVERAPIERIPVERAPVERAYEPPAKAVDHSPITERIANLRQRLGAETVLLVETSGKMIAQSGDLPQTALIRAWVPAILENLALSLKASESLGVSQPENILAFRGESFDVVAAPLGRGHAILVILPLSSRLIRMAVTVEELLEAEKDLAAGLGEETQPVKAAAAEPPAKTVEPKTQPSVAVSTSTTPVDEADELEALFKKGKPSLSASQVDAFWDQVAQEKGKTVQPNGDTLTYEQAIRMGITPKNGGGQA